MSARKPLSKFKKVVYALLVILVIVFVSKFLVLGAATLLSQTVFNSDQARMDARSKVETELRLIDGVKDAAVIERLGGTPPTKKSLVVNVYVDQVPSVAVLTGMVKSAFEKSWLGYDAFIPDDITLQILHKKRPANGIEEQVGTGLGIDLRETKKELPWVSTNSTKIAVVSRSVLREQFGTSGDDAQ